MDVNNPSLRFGYYTATRKMSLCHAFASWVQEWALSQGVSIETVPINLEDDLDRQGPFDVVVTKVTHLTVKQDQDRKAKEALNNVVNYLERHKEVVQLDPVSAQVACTNRFEMTYIFEYLNRKLASIDVYCPPTTLVPDDNKPLTAYVNSEFKFPAIAKTVQACGAKCAHEMVLVWSLDDINRFKRPLIVQPYLNHNATMAKVYVVGSDSTVIKRKSLPNLKPEPQHDPVFFNSQKYKHTVPPGLVEAADAGKAQLPSQDVIDAITKALSDLLELSLFGYDLITDSETGKHAIIDINYFPGYSEVANFNLKLFHHMLSMYKKKHGSLPFTIKE